MSPGLIYESGMGIAPAVEEHQVFTITTIPEFALAALESRSAFGHWEMDSVIGKARERKNPFLSSRNV